MRTKPISADLAFIHLSDIHFRRGVVGDVHEKDRLLRHELGLDLRRLRSRLPKVDGVIISGDIAYSGKPEEFEFATGWIDSICEQLGCPHDGIMVTPGNHDVDYGSMNGVGALQAEIRQGVGVEEHDAHLANILRDPDRGPSLLQPLAAYNRFSGQYTCAFDCTRPFWERDFRLRDGTILRFRGIATTFLSGPNDNIQTGRMLYGGAQRTFLREPNVRYVIVGHHPPSWSIEGDIAEQTFSQFSSLQIFGHKHENWTTRIGDSVRLIAGAVHPSRAESHWLPRYAAITASAVDAKTLRLCIYPRRWTSEESKFMADFDSDGQDFRDYTMPVDARQALA